MSCKFRLLLPSGLIEKREIGKEGGKLQAEEVAARPAAEEKDRPERPTGCVNSHKTRFIVVRAIAGFRFLSPCPYFLHIALPCTQIDLHHSRLMYFYPSSASFLSLNLRHSVILAKEEEQTLFVMVRMVTIFLFETTANITATAANLNLLVCGWQALAGRGSWRAG